MLFCNFWKIAKLPFHSNVNQAKEVISSTPLKLGDLGSGIEWSTIWITSCPNSDYDYMAIQILRPKSYRCLGFQSFFDHFDHFLMKLDQFSNKRSKKLI